MPSIKIFFKQLFIFLSCRAGDDEDEAPPRPFVVVSFYNRDHSCSDGLLMRNGREVPQTSATKRREAAALFLRLLLVPLRLMCASTKVCTLILRC